jgi:hypothetical protein
MEKRFLTLPHSGFVQQVAQAEQSAAHFAPSQGVKLLMISNDEYHYVSLYLTYSQRYTIEIDFLVNLGKRNY